MARPRQETDAGLTGRTQVTWENGHAGLAPACPFCVYCVREERRPRPKPNTPPASRRPASHSGNAPPPPLLWFRGPVPLVPPLKGRVPPVPVPGVVVGGAVTVTEAEVVIVPPALLVTVTVKVYVPALLGVNVAV